MNDILKSLNTEQKKAVSLTQGPVLVLAGPGTGKTQLLSARCAKIIKDELSLPENILVLTFTNIAAKAMKDRLAQLVGRKGYDVEVCTFHSFANSILLESEEAANYVKDRIQISDIEKIKAIEFILDNLEGVKDLKPFGNPYMYREKIEKRIGDLKKEDISPEAFEEYVDKYKPDGVLVQDKHVPKLKALAKIYKMYENIKDAKVKGIFEERGRYDYDDMVMLAVKALRNEKDLQDKYQEQYKYIMVDEFQDTNGAQLDLLFALAKGDNPNICCVGDDDQSIFRFQGATITNFKTFERKFPKVEVIYLKSNYRSTKEIIDLSSKIIKQLPEAARMGDKELVPKKDFKVKNIELHEFTTEEEELLFMIDKIKQLKEIIQNSSELDKEETKQPYNQIAVLVRKRNQILKIIDAFLLAGIPYATDGKEDISGEKRVKQMLDVLYLACSQKPDIDFDPSLTLFKVLCSDYLEAEHSDVLRLISLYKKKRSDLQAQRITFFNEFLVNFPVDTKTQPSRQDSEKLPIAKQADFKNINSLHKAAWAIQRLLIDAMNRPAHNLLLEYIEDANLYNYILKAYDKESVLKIRDLRSLTSFVNMLKEMDLSRPGIGLLELLDEIETRKEHDIPLQGELVTQTQDGVRIYTAHGSKGLEFHSVFIPFCLQDKNWPVRYRGDALPLPPEILKSPKTVTDKNELSALNFYDETRLFYVASSRAKSNLIFTASPSEDSIRSSFLDNIELGQKQEKKPSEEKLLVRFLQKTKSQDPFIKTHDILKDLISNLTLSPTSLNNYLNCKRKFLYDNVLMLPGKKREYLVFGSCAHKALEKTYSHFKETGRFPNFEFFKNAFKTELKLQGISQKAQKHCLDKLETFSDWYKQASIDPVKPIGLEKKISIALADGLVFTGNYDKTELEDDKDKLVRVLDYKTGAPDKHIKGLANNADLASPDCEDYFRQLVSYKLLFDKDKKTNNGFKVSHGVLVFLEPVKNDVIKYGLKKDQFVNKKIELTQDLAVQLEKQIAEAWKNIKNLDFDKLPEKDKEQCGNCDFSSICWQ